MRHRERPILTALLALACAPALGDEVYLQGGGKLTGVVVERTATSLIIETGPGRVGVPLSRVKRVVRAPSHLAEFQRRATALAPGDLSGWLALGEWARRHDLDTQAREAFERARQLDPDNAAAQSALGNVAVDGRWMSPDDARRAQGLVPFEGEWISPEERTERLRVEREEAAAKQARAEAEARAREAEARARAAEADARRAESEARAAEEGGTPVWFGAGPGLVFGDDCRGDCCHGGCASEPPVLSPPPPPAPSRRQPVRDGAAPDRPRDVPSSGGVPPVGPQPGGRRHSGGAADGAPNDGRAPRGD
jgi:hypothetical protein